MKTVFSVIISYIFTLVCGTLAIALLVMAYFGCTQYVVGTPLSLYSWQTFLVGVKIGFPYIAIFSSMFLILSLIRHSKKNRFVGLISICVLTCATWFGILPIFYKYFPVTNEVQLAQKNDLSPGFFRVNKNKLYYFTSVSKSQKTADGILINTMQLSTKDSAFKVIKNESTEVLESGNFSDILVKRLLEFPSYLVEPIESLNNICQNGEKIFSKSYLNWLFFCSFGVALFFVFGVSNVSKWRLVNFFLIISSTFLLIILNVICTGFAVHQNFFLFISEFDFKIKSAIPFLSYCDYPICFFVNILWILIFSIFALINKLKNKKVED